KPTPILMVGAWYIKTGQVSVLLITMLYIGLLYIFREEYSHSYDQVLFFYICLVSLFNNSKHISAAKNAHCKNYCTSYYLLLFLNFFFISCS
ncbi:hypothetical protein L9F63_003631, partial [Diploptera punctata]